MVFIPYDFYGLLSPCCHGNIFLPDLCNERGWKGSKRKIKKHREMKVSRCFFLAERKGFEPLIQLPVYTLSRRAPSTTRTSLHVLSARSILSCLAGQVKRKKSFFRKFFAMIMLEYRAKNTAVYCSDERAAICQKSSADRKGCNFASVIIFCPSRTYYRTK